MSVKAKAPEEDPETKLRRELAEKRAEAGRLEELGESVSDSTRAVIRRFGRIEGSNRSTGSLASTLPSFGGGSVADRFVSSTYGGSSSRTQTSRPLTQLY